MPKGIRMSNTLPQRTGLLAVALAALTTACAVTSVPAAPAAPTASSLGPASTVDDVLGAMQARGGDLKSFTATVTQSLYNTTFDTTETYHGKVVFQFLPDGDARMHLVLDDKQKGTNPPESSKKEYLLEDGWLTDRDYPMKNQVRRQIVAPGQKLDLFQLGKGPFPLPIGQDKAEVTAQFTVEKMPPAGTDPKGLQTIHLQLTPKPRGTFSRQFKLVDFWIDTASGLPVRIETLDYGGVIDQTNDLTNVAVNPAVGNGDFTLPPLNNALPPANRKWAVDAIPLATAPSPSVAPVAPPSPGQR